MTRPTALSADTVCTIITPSTETNEYGEPIGEASKVVIMAQVNRSPSTTRNFTNSSGQQFTPKIQFVFELQDVDGNAIDKPVVNNSFIAEGDFSNSEPETSHKIIMVEAPSVGVLRGQIPDVRVSV